MNEKIFGFRKKKVEAMSHCEGDTDVKNLYHVYDSDSDNCISKLHVKRGPTITSHCSSTSKSKPDYVPSSDENLEEDEDIQMSIFSYPLCYQGEKVKVKIRKGSLGCGMMLEDHG